MEPSLKYALRINITYLAGLYRTIVERESAANFPVKWDGKPPLCPSTTSYFYFP
jgi:hypothetical protein